MALFLALMEMPVETAAPPVMPQWIPLSPDRKPDAQADCVCPLGQAPTDNHFPHP